MMIEFVKNLADYVAASGKKHEYNPNQRSWKYLNTLAEGNAMQEDSLSFEGEFEEEEEEYYYPSFPFIARFSCFKVTCLLCYCSEGDNIPDAFHLAEAACKLLGQSPTNFHGCIFVAKCKCSLFNGNDKWFIPISWKTLYRPPTNMSLF
ncbi:hypothetical protein RchiOBHm_Chr7g0218511 [Rosa chinensis]|uniref:Uncharacterized protein n=1 Tax=Rosa chinensis TaxID=74649 RepID=A0A2P6PCA4_ROSCH|nr:hypothetical protein RchiOBHm_Chr7g0218511 [Rosa chinensis]